MKIYKKLTLLLFAAGLVLGNSACNRAQEQTKNQEEIRTAALQEWKQMKFGLFIHWGIFSVPAGVWEGKQIDKLGEQIQRHADIPHEEYMALAKEFNPQAFDADKIVSLAKDAGMKYVVLTTKHHDGFCMFDSKYTDFDVVDATPYKKDILGELAEACKKHGLKLGLYYSNPDWHFNYPAERNPADGLLSVFSKMSKSNEEYEVNQLTELLTRYGDITELFFDMGEPTMAQSKRFADLIHQLQPRCMINGRIMNNQGDFLTMPDNHCPEMPIDTIAWEMPGTFYHTWGYKSWVKGLPLPEQIRKQVRNLSKIASRGGNFLLNIGPKPDGTVPEYEIDVLKGISAWMKTNAAAIHGTSPTPFVHLPWGECTQNGNKLYLHIHEWPGNGQLLVPGLRNGVKAIYPLDKSLSRANDIEHRSSAEGTLIDLRGIQEDPDLTILVLEYEGELDIEDPIISTTPGEDIVLPGSAAQKHERYGKMSYRSILRDYSRSWDVDILEAGSYAVTITYKMKLADKDFKLQAGNGQPLLFNLKGDASLTAKSELIDGNETAKKPTGEKVFNRTQERTAEAGILDIPQTGRTTIWMKPGQDFKMYATTAEDKAQDQRYKNMNIDIKSITLRKID